MDADSRTEAIRELRCITGASMLECKTALARCSGDITLALEYLREHGDEPPEPEPGRVN